MADVSGASQGLINDFLDRLSKFSNYYQELLSLRNKAEQIGLGEEYNKLNSKAVIITKASNPIVATINAVKGFLSSSSKMEGMGVIPLLVPAVIVGAIAFIGSWLTDYIMFRTKINRYDELIAQNIDPRQAIDVIRGLSPPPLINFNKLLLPILAVGGIWFMIRRRG